VLFEIFVSSCSIQPFFVQLKAGGSIARAECQPGCSAFPVFRFGDATCCGSVISSRCVLLVVCADCAHCSCAQIANVIIDKLTRCLYTTVCMTGRSRARREVRVRKNFGPNLLFSILRVKGNVFPQKRVRAINTSIWHTVAIDGEAWVNVVLLKLRSQYGFCIFLSATHGIPPFPLCQ